MCRPIIEFSQAVYIIDPDFHLILAGYQPAWVMWYIALIPQALVLCLIYTHKPEGACVYIRQSTRACGISITHLLHIPPIHLLYVPPLYTSYMSPIYTPLYTSHIPPVNPMLGLLRATTGRYMTHSTHLHRFPHEGEGNTIDRQISVFTFTCRSCDPVTDHVIYTLLCGGCTPTFSHVAIMSSIQASNNTCLDQSYFLSNTSASNSDT